MLQVPKALAVLQMQRHGILSFPFYDADLQQEIISVPRAVMYYSGGSGEG